MEPLQKNTAENIASQSGEAGSASGQCRLAVLALHPVPYHSPLYRALHNSDALDVTVLYLRPHGFDILTDGKGEAKQVTWKMDLVSGHRHEFVKHYDVFNKPVGFFSRINPGLITRLFSRRYDVVLIQGYTLFSMWLALVAAKLSRTRTIWRGEIVKRSGEDQSALKKWLKRTLAGLMIKRCDAVLYTCSGNREFLDMIGVKPSKLHPLPCAVDNDFMQESRRNFSPLREKTRTDLDIPEEDFVVIYCGRLTRGKRVHDLLEAVKRTGKQDITILLVGDGPDRHNVETTVDRLKVNVRFTGFVDQTELGRYYTVADLFVIMSEHDRSPKTLNEAMNFGLPVIATNVVGTAYDLVFEGDNGFLVDVGDVKMTAEKIALLANDRALAKQMGGRSEEVVSGFTFEADVVGVVSACQAALGNGRARA